MNKHKGFVRFGLTHIIATNICVWALAVITETAEDFRMELEEEIAHAEKGHHNETRA